MPRLTENPMRLLMIDNYDSFTHNLVQLFFQFDVEVLVHRHDRITLPQIQKLRPHWICISPGPGTPSQSGISKAVIAVFGGHIPTLGVCLGMQAINEVFGGTTLRAPAPVHGKRSVIHHTGESIFTGTPSPFRAARYHSLQSRVKEPRPLRVTSWCEEDGVVMGISHDKLPIVGVQFHPESFMSEYGWKLMCNFLSLNPRWKNPLGHLEKENRFQRSPAEGQHPPKFPKEGPS